LGIFGRTGSRFECFFDFGLCTNGSTDLPSIACVPGDLRSDKNLLLRELVATDDAYPDAFTYSVLQILPKTAAVPETLEWERLYKQKLGSMATVLNAN
jgi:hypothetical protein